jgi:lipopolysaccharide transport system permease protein
MSSPAQNPSIVAPSVYVICPSSGWMGINVRELWTYRELLYFLVWRSLKVRYKQTVLGATWAFLQPLMAMVIFSIFFGRLAKMPSDGVPYPIFVYCGLLPWQLFSQAVTECGNSLVGNQHLITKVYFPRLIMPIAGVVTGMVDFAIAFLLLLGMQVYYGIYPHARLLLFPLFILFAMMTALAIGIWLSALNVKYRDVRYLIPFLTQFWLFATPVAYPSSLVPARWRPLVGLNPMAGVVEGFRWALLGTRSGAGPLVLVSALIVLLMLFSGIAYFRNMEKTFADLI